MIRKALLSATAGLVLGCLGSLAFSSMAADKGPMPQTRGMQGMDPKLHDQPAKDPYEGCTPKRHGATTDAGMPQTRGMKDMDPRAHEVVCPEAPVNTDSGVPKQRHVHRGSAG